MSKKPFLFMIVFLFFFVGCSKSNLENIDVKSIKEKTKNIKKEDLEEVKKQIKKIRS